jgi:phenylacetic acid degradation operon negative regulatory protein
MLNICNDLDSFINQRAEVANISCKSFIVTVFGDVISQHGHWVWLGSLIESLEPLGFSERLIRTSVFRLVKDDWLQVKKVGRKSYYAFTESANNHYTKAARRIYAGSTQHSDGRWLIVIPSLVNEDKLVLLKRQLRWLGFSTLTSGAYAHPSIDQTSLEETIKELELNDSVIIFSSRLLNDASSVALKTLVFDKWNIESLEYSYQSLLDSYQPILELLESNKTTPKFQHTQQQYFLIRLLLIHEYRRILLKDHELPENLLPEKWSGLIANHLVKHFYSVVAEKSTNFVNSEMQDSDGYLSKAIKSFKKRFK